MQRVVIVLPQSNSTAVTSTSSSGDKLTSPVIPQVNWKSIDPRISGRPLLEKDGLFMVTVPAMFPFSVLPEP